MLSQGGRAPRKAIRTDFFAFIQVLSFSQTRTRKHAVSALLSAQLATAKLREDSCWPSLGGTVRSHGAFGFCLTGTVSI